MWSAACQKPLELGLSLNVLRQCLEEVRVLCEEQAQRSRYSLLLLRIVAEGEIPPRLVPQAQKGELLYTEWREPSRIDGHTHHGSITVWNSEERQVPRTLTAWLHFSGLSESY